MDEKTGRDSDCSMGKSYLKARIYVIGKEILSGRETSHKMRITGEKHYI
jgi:hypothetical protein